jgi:membrane protease YdiL (CAAX protease family)
MSLLFTALFLLMKLPVELSVYLLLPSNSAESSHASLFKIALSAGFVVPAILFFGLYGKKSGYRVLLSAFRIENVPDRKKIAWFISYFCILPFALQILGTEIDTLSRTIFPCDESYNQFIRVIEPTGHPLDLFGAYFTIGLVGPFIEEIFFRGFLLSGLRNHYSRKWLPILAQALLFGASHLNRWQFFYASLMGVLFGYLTVRHMSIWPSVLAHISNNTFAVSILYFFQDIPFLGRTECKKIEHLPPFLLGGAIFILVAILLTSILGKVRNETA